MSAATIVTAPRWLRSADQGDQLPAEYEEQFHRARTEIPVPALN